MKKVLLILLFVQFVALQPKAADTTAVQNALVDNVNRNFYIEKQLDIYKFIPSNLWLWENGDFSSILVKTTSESGDFKLIDDFENDKKFSFKSESVQSFNKSGWRFYGNFTYSSSNHENALWNLGYKQSEIGNPYRLITQREGDFSVKHYGLNGIMNKKLNEKFTIGLGINYQGDLYFRLSDTRNEMYNLTSEYSASVNYTLAKNRVLALGASYYYKKGSPQFSNKFKTTGTEYYLYFNEGLGDFNKIDISERLYLKNQNPKYYISYFSGDKNKLSISYSLFPGKERWEYIITSLNSDTNEELYNYEYLSNEIIASYLITKSDYKIFNQVNASFITGTGHKTSYLKTFIYDRFVVEATSDILRPYANLFYLSTIALNLESLSKKDMIYAQQLEYTNLIAKVKTGYRFYINKQNKLAIDVEATYKHNLSYLHDVVAAAAKPYTTNLAYNEVAYYSANYVKVGTDLKWYAQFKNIGTEIYLNYNYLKPLKLPSNNQYSELTKNDNRHFLQAGLNIYF